jgi:uncharacterized membrane-anchored protein
LHGFGCIERNIIMSSRNLLIGGVLLQLVVLIAMIVFKATPLWTGEPIWLRVVPVDPRDMFRGDYVTLSYEFSRVPSRGIPELGPLTHDQRHAWQGETVYVALVPEADGKHWRMERISTQPPAEGKYLRGTIVAGPRIQCGIESYYVEEGSGREFEDAARGGRLSAEVSLAADGRAVLRRLQQVAPRAESGPAFDPPSKSRWPNAATYRVRFLPLAKIRLDGRFDEPEWYRANSERHFTFPWKKAEAPPTEFSAFCDDQYFYFGFRADDADIVVLDTLRDKEDGLFEDRVELYFSRDPQMKAYFNLEIDSRGRVFDYSGAYYRQVDTKWHCEGVEAVGRPLEKGYAVEGRIPQQAFAAMGLPQLKPGARVLCGLYRAEFSHDRSGKPVVQTETIHNRGRKPPGVPPIEEWISWIDPQTPEPDFHVPSSLGWLEVVD